MKATRTSPLRRALKIAVVSTAILIAVVIATVLIGGLWLRSELRASLPELDGEEIVAGLATPVTVERDGLGIPTIRARGRLDVARATGFVHAQDRFFQMDLLRRGAAGELAELLGGALVESDRSIRVHRFRHTARRALEHGPARERAVAEAYAAGVNAGLSSLGADPFEYILLRRDPAPWTVEDTVLVALAMFIDLQDEDGSRESAVGVMHDLLPRPLFEFLTTRGTEWDAPLIGPPVDAPPIPDPASFDLRTDPAVERPAEALPVGSNSFAVSGELTAHGSAILANDMHLGLSVPNIWYRASFEWSGADGQEHRVTGITLPGAPAMVVGSNGHAAWGFTNSYGDWTDLVILEPDPEDEDAYLTPDGPRKFDRFEEKIRVAGGEDQVLEVLQTIWGPVIDEDHRGRPRALRWVAHDPEAVNLGLIWLETARDVDEAIRLANRSGAPAQNFVVADAEGRTGWSILGIVPRRFGFDGSIPTSWADGSRGWDGWLDPEDYPRIVDPPAGRLWTANNRVVGGAMLQKIGDGGFALGARAGQIRDRLFDLERATERDLLDIQLDDRAVFLERWRDLLLELLTPEALEADPRRREFRRLVEQDWTGRASVDSVGFRLVRAFRLSVSDGVFETLVAPCRKADPEFAPVLFQIEGPVWKLVRERPSHLLDPRYDDWKDRLLATVDETVEHFTKDGAPLSESTWGRRNTVRVRHPLSRAVPVLGRWLDMPAIELPGAGHMPRVQGLGSGASQRMVVSPGREEHGIFHMPGGQSGHPLSPHYGDAHEAWARGEPSPFLPGEPVHTLRLLPGP